MTANIFGTGDLVIELKYCKWAVHQEKIEDVSGFFRNALKGDQWKVCENVVYSTTLSYILQEGREHYIKLHDECPIMFARFIQFLYRGKYAYHSPQLETWFGYAVKVCENLDLRYLVYGKPIYKHPFREGDESDEFESDIDGVILYGPRRWWEYEPQHFIDEDVYRDATDLDSQKVADIRSDKWKYRAEVDIAMYKLADKYFIPSLQDYALTMLQKNIGSIDIRGVDYASILKALNEAYPSLDLVEERLKKTIAVCFARDYKVIRTRRNDAAIAIRDWLHSDETLSSMVLDHLTGIGDVDIDSGLIPS